MAEYIERGKVHEMMVGLKRYSWTSPVSTEHHVTVDADDVNFGVDKIPAADVVEVVHGEWEKVPPYTSVIGKYKKALICSRCRAHFVSDGDLAWMMPNYCPHCGAKMEGERKETE